MYGLLRLMETLGECSMAICTNAKQCHQVSDEPPAVDLNLVGRLTKMSLVLLLLLKMVQN